MRYAGQEHTLTVQVPGDRAIAGTADGSARRSAPTTADLRPRDGGGDRDRLAPGDDPHRPSPPRRGDAGRHVQRGRGAGRNRAAWSFTRSERLPFAIVARSSIDEAGISGPAIVLEPTATTYLDAEFTARSGPGGVLHLTDTKGV